jgi:hypothetical protein
LDQLSESEDLICKEYNSKIYLTSQKFFKVIDEAQSSELDVEIDQTKENVTELKEKSSNLQSSKIN